MSPWFFLGFLLLTWILFGYFIIDHDPGNPNPIVTKQAVMNLIKEPNSLKALSQEKIYVRQADIMSDVPENFEIIKYEIFKRYEK